MHYEFNTYTTSDGDLEVSFLFVETEPEDWKAYILTDIDYKKYDEDRETSLTKVHRLWELDDRISGRVFKFIRDNEIPYRNTKLYYICWTQDVTSLEDMKEVAKAWTELTNCYRKSGGLFSDYQRSLREAGLIGF